MASKTTLNATNLEALGAARLAELLIEVSTGSAAAKRKLRLALAGAQGPDDAARAIGKRLTSIARARSSLSWQSRKTLVDDLEMQRRAIIEQVAPAEPREALALLWRFMGLADSVLDRCHDSGGTVIGVFHAGCRSLGDAARAANPPTRDLAEAVCQALQGNSYGQYDGLVEIMAPALGAEGLVHLKALVEELGRTPLPVPPEDKWQAFGWGRDGPIYVHVMREAERQRTVSMALQDIADAQGDVDGFIAQYDTATRGMPLIAVEIARRLLAAGRAEEALSSIEGVEFETGEWIPDEWQNARLAVLEALGRKEEAQSFRWTCFEQDLSVEHLRAFLKRLPDFEDFSAEERAMAHAMAHPDVLDALQFFLGWPALGRAASLLTARHAELDGDHYEYLVPAAEALAERYPLAATLALRAMVDFTLSAARSSRYGHAAQHLATCAALAADIADFGALEEHDAYVARLKREHGRKYGFWSHVGY